MTSVKNIKIWSVCILFLTLTSCTSKDKEDSNIPSVPEGTDLSVSNSFANCYLVNKAGNYFFEVKHIDGTRVEGIVSADWIWSTYDRNKNSLLSNVRYEDGYICFSMKNEHGNALIGAFDASGNIVWSWHIWMTETIEHQTLDSGAVFMDRNLGAMSANPEDGALTYGLKYQWGRKDPFYGGDNNENPENVFSEAKKATIINPRLNLEWTAVIKDAKTGTVGFSIANPTTFVYTDRNGDGCDWLTERNDYLWDDAVSNSKTNYDPCPAGYRVAYDGAWEGCGYWNVDDDPVNGGRIHTTASGEKIWWPLSGTRWG